MKKIQLLLAIITVSIIASIAFAQTERPEWQSYELVNAKTGETFSLGGFEDKIVFVEPMATWCSNCRAQLKNVAKAQAKSTDDVVFVALSLEGNIADEKLAAYAQKEGFEMIFAKASQKLLEELINLYGRGVSSPPSTPHFIIAPDGSTTEMKLGREAADILLAQIDAVRSK